MFESKSQIILLEFRKDTPKICISLITHVRVNQEGEDFKFNYFSRPHFKIDFV